MTVVSSLAKNTVELVKKASMIFISWFQQYQEGSASLLF